MDKNKKKILKKMNLEETQETLNSLKGKELDTFNFHYQKIKGKEEYDYITINNFSKENAVEKFENILEFDQADWAFQKEHLTMVRENYDSLYLPGIWFRAVPFNFLGKRALLYGQLESARSYMLREIFELIRKKIDKKYPSLYIHEYGKNALMSETEIRACGFEKERTLLLTELHRLNNEIENEIIEIVKKFENYTFTKESKDPIMNGLTVYIFGGMKSAESTRLKSFFKDFIEKEQPIQVLEKIIKKLSKKYFKKIKYFSKKI